MASTLIADIGGTNSRFALAEGGRPGPMVRLADDDIDGPEALIAAAIAGLPAVAVDSAVLALAGPVTDAGVALTNRQWTFRREALARRFGLKRLVLVNDFEALAHALPALGAGDLRTLSAGSADSGPMLVLGPGTGLGAAVHRPGSEPQVLATEAGHMSFGPASSDEEAVFAAIRTQAGFVSAETILSGPGLERLHTALHGGERLSPAAIAARVAEGDRQALRTFRLFTRLLGRFAGDLALAFRSSGGLFLAGGVLRHLQDHIEAEILHDAFASHPPYAAWLGRIPLHVVVAEEPGLIGCATLAQAFRL